MKERRGGKGAEMLLAQMSTYKITKDKDKSLQLLNIFRNTKLGALLKLKSQNVHYNLQRREINLQNLLHQVNMFKTRVTNIIAQIQMLASETRYSQDI